MDKEEAKKYIEESKKQYKGKIKRLTYPSVTKLERKGLSPSYLAVWIQDGIPQHCQCVTERDGWWIINDRMGGKNKCRKVRLGQ